MGLLQRLFDRQACPADRETFWHVIDTRPVIIYLQGSIKHMVFVNRALRGTRALLLRGGVGCEEHPKFARRWGNYYRKARRFYPEHKIVFLRNSADSARQFADRGLPTLFCSQNAFLDENMYRIVPAQKEFDAVYNAQMERVKRHSLASRIQNLALITYRLDSQPAYYKEVKKTLEHAVWLNFESGQYEWIRETDVSYQLNRARVGVMLSDIEGANYATVEYLLSGLPVVSTESSGGRSVFYGDDFVKVVEATPEAVAEGVQEMIGRKIDPEYIRQETLAKMGRHREVFIDLLQKFCDEEGVLRDMKAEWSVYFTNKLLRWRRLGDLYEILGKA